MKIQYMCAFLLGALAISVMGKFIRENEKYIVLLKEGATDEQIEEVIQLIEGHESLPRKELLIESDNTLLPIIFGTISKETSEKISELDIVEVVEEDQIMTLEEIRDEQEVIIDEDLEVSPYLNAAFYNLDIIDDVKCIDGTYSPFDYGTGVDIYIVDTGIYYEHLDFRGTKECKQFRRAKYGGYDVDASNRAYDELGTDCQGHGSHCAGIAAGLYSGIAKNANLYSIRVFGCSGGARVSTIIEGLRVVSDNHKKKKDRVDFVASIASMSLGGGKSKSMDTAVNILVKEGIIVVTASGNERQDACNKSPGSAGSNINVGAHGYDRRTCKKPLAYFSNYGKCVDIVAPGVSVLSTSIKCYRCLTYKSGTSMSCPHVAGMAALMKSANPTLTPAKVKQNIRSKGIDDIDRSAMPKLVQKVSDAKRAYISKALVSK